MIAATTTALGGQEPVLLRTEPPEAYWADPAAGLEVAGYGCADWLESGPGRGWAEVLEEVLASERIRWDPGRRPPGPWMGGLAFAPDEVPRGGWAGFPGTRWVLPRRLRWRQEGRAYETHFAGEGRTGARAAAEGAAAFLEPPVGRRRWTALVQRARGEIRRGRLQKVVLARAVDWRGCAPGLVTVLERLREASPRARTFLVQGPGACFLGASPERLLSLRGGGLRTEAVAATGRVGEEGALGAGAKEREEHSIVVEGIARALRPLALRLEVGAAPGHISQGGLAHLRTPLEAQLRPGVRLADVLRALHPTAALGGEPREEALRFLSAHEGLNRGWYGGAVGILGEEGAELAVAIRSALVRADGIRLFVGAGVVAGSDPEEEWRETERKQAPMRRALEVPFAA